METKVSPDLNKVLANYYYVVIKPLADLIVQEINSQIDPDDWIDLRPDLILNNQEISEPES